MVATRQSRRMYRVCWASMIGRSCGQGRPLPKDVAEFVVHDEELAHPMRKYWLEACERVCEEAASETPVSGEFTRH